jgi:hypothetical protein
MVRRAGSFCNQDRHQRVEVQPRWAVLLAAFEKVLRCVIAWLAPDPKGGKLATERSWTGDIKPHRPL